VVVGCCAWHEADNDCVLWRMHGGFDAGRPLLLGRLLVGDAQHEGILTVGELYDLQLNVLP
jgi:hypothetical protein